MGNPPSWLAGVIVIIIIAIIYRLPDIRRQKADARSTFETNMMAELDRLRDDNTRLDEMLNRERALCELGNRVVRHELTNIANISKMIFEGLSSGTLTAPKAVEAFDKGMNQWQCARSGCEDQMRQEIERKHGLPAGSLKEPD